ncbi:GNAT family N-acetyltransferase [Paenibacillus aquistagni]|uniref:GNAT family N-acetyltransferase n=1 Tax=Paenibacillus aquistagni TaxID=1852522 RepID=UPI0021652249|nr:GNAT family N-acetyltransferase [Paenibacillus aquistagni]
MAEQFVDDPLYEFILPDVSRRRQALIHFFQSYLTLLYPYSDVFASSERMEAVALVFYSDRFKDTLSSRLLYQWRVAKAIGRGLPICRLIGLQGYWRGLRILNQASSAWLEMLGERSYMHLDMLVIQKPYRGQGLMTALMSSLVNQCRGMNSVLTLETQNKANLPKYERYGFQVIHQHPIPNSSLIQYGMCLDPEVLGE